MNAGLWTKVVYESWRVVVLFAIGMFVFHVSFNSIFRTVVDAKAALLLDNAFLQNIMRALLGADIGDQISSDALDAMAWVQPVGLMLLWAHAVTFCTRMPAGEIDRGTADVLFALPLTRWQHYACETTACLLSGLVLILAAVAGNLVVAGTEGPPLIRLVMVAANLFGLYWAVAGIAYLVSSLSNRRGVAVGVVFGIVVTLFFIEFVAPFWPPAQMVSGLGPLHHYRPLKIMAEGTWPIADLVALFGLGTGLWFAGGWIFARRDICTT